MAYTARNNRPGEWASKSSHSNVINDKLVQSYLSSCELPKEKEDIDLNDFNVIVDVEPVTNPIQHIIAVDGGYTEAVVKKKFPSSKIAFFQFGALFFDLQHLENLSQSDFIFPEDMAKFKELERFKLVLPIKNIIYDKSDSLTNSVRSTLCNFFTEDRAGRNFMETLKWLVFEEYNNGDAAINYKLASCPYCDTKEINLDKNKIRDSYKFECTKCKGELYLIDIFRLHEVIDDELGAEGILGYVTTLIEQIIVIHYIKYILQQQPSLLSKIMFLKDGPLAFFGPTANIHKLVRKLCNYLMKNNNLFLAGLEKSGSFVEHAIEITSKREGANPLLDKPKALLLKNDYIYKYVLPKTESDPPPYARTSYYGGKLIFRSQNDRVYVVTVPVSDEKVVLNPKKGDFKNLDVILDTIEKLKCDMYDNSLVPIALANKLVSLANHPSGVLLEKFAKDTIAKA